MFSTRSFCEMAFKSAGIDVIWKGEGADEKGINSETGDVVVAVDVDYYRPTEVDLLIGDASKAKEKLGWEPTYTIEELVKEMVQEDLELIRRKAYLKSGGFGLKNHFE